MVCMCIVMTDPTDSSDQDIQMSSPSVTTESSFPPGGGSRRSTGSTAAIVVGMQFIFYNKFNH